MADSKIHPVLVRALVQCLKEIFSDGFYSDKVIARTFKNNRKWGSRDRKFMAESIYDMVRWWERLTQYDGLPFDLNNPQEYLLRWIGYALWKKQISSFEDIQAVAGSVDPKVFEEIKKRVEGAALDPWQEHSFPRWLYEKFTEQFKDETPSLLTALNQQAPVSLRANTLKGNRSQAQQKLLEEGIETHVSEISPEGLVLNERKNVFTTKCFKDGFFEVQDEASQRVSYMLSPKPGERIADVCAGAGGKTLHLAALMQNKGSLLAGDVSERKLEELKIRARRAGVSNLRIQFFEGTKSVKKLHDSFDGVLIDAPCSGSGVIRRNPDTKWKLSPEEIERLKGLQILCLETYSKLVKKNGRMIYATCSVLDEENAQQVDKFLATHPHFKRDGEPLHTRPDKTSEDGFFAQKLIRTE